MSWSVYIKQDMIARIHSGHDLPSKLTLRELSRRYKVSVTPVRAAVGELIEGRYLLKGQNGRLAVNPNKVGCGGPAASPAQPELPKDHYDEIAKDLVALSLTGKPIWLRDKRIAKQHGISQTAVRQILSRLAGVGMVEYKPRRGWRLRPFRQEDMDAFNQMRELLELKAMELAWPHLVDDDLRAILDRNVVPDDASQPILIDNSLHQYLIEKAGNRYISDFFRRHGRYYELLFRWEGSHREALVKPAREHRTITEALLARDIDTAGEVLIAHIRYSHPILSSRPLADALLEWEKGKPGSGRIEVPREKEDIEQP